MKPKKATKAKAKRTKITNRKLVQVTMQIFADQKEVLDRKSKKVAMQALVRKALDANGLCDKSYLRSA